MKTSQALKASESRAVPIIPRTLEVTGGGLPRRALALTIEWAMEHRTQLMEGWTPCQSRQHPTRIKPLE
ncbi:DUF4160 domain-containing protein [Methyloversatilis discipulorum]|uniref:DUF4160 domain-containing protein n=1 Tax=Methyloversatilis discipulorum TaxID=1119528 RepID=UPI0026E99406|nr:DUF4160 domain-containing protein [Methyloversatilis discipulorum]